MWHQRGIKKADGVGAEGVRKEVMGKEAEKVGRTQREQEAFNQREHLMITLLDDMLVKETQRKDEYPQ